jgi:hypothetical protein
VPSGPPEQAIKLVRRKAPRAAVTLVGSQSVPPSRRRQFARAPYVTPVFLVLPSVPAVEARSEEISEEGMLVLSPVPVVLGAQLTLRFASPVTGAILVVAGSVRWTRAGRGKTALGVEFLGIAPEVRQVIAEYLAAFPVAPSS